MKFEPVGASIELGLIIIGQAAPIQSELNHTFDDI